MVPNHLALNYLMNYVSYPQLQMLAYLLSNGRSESDNDKFNWIWLEKQNR